jgi:hypothetical protein
VASVVLFVQRASAASASFELTADNSADVAEICRRLDGLPLALELVAPKVRSLSAAEIAARLDRRLPFVRTAGWIREQRHRTLRAVVDWSHQLLDERQQQLFERLSVFVGSFTLDGAERVAGGRLDPAEIADVITALVDRSMLGAQPGRAPTRYALLETLRLYGRERLRAPRLPSTRVHSDAPRRPFRVGQDMRKGRRLPPDMLTLASHTTTDKDQPAPHPNRHHDQLTMTRSSSPRLAVNRWYLRLPRTTLASGKGHDHGGRRSAEVS